METINDFVNASMNWERVASKADAEIRKLSAAAKQERIAAKKEKREPDLSLSLYADELRGVKHRAEKQAEKYWKQARELAVPHDGNLEELLNAVVLKAVNDYETALFNRDTATMTTLEWFLTDTITSRIKRKYTEFKRIARSHADEIADYTKRIRKASGDMALHAKYRCPICGGGLYVYAKQYAGHRLICCTGCQCMEAVP